MGQPPSEEFAPGARARWGMAMEEAPDCSPGLLAISNPQQRQTLLCGYYSEVEEATPGVEGTGESVDLVHECALAGWLSPGQSFSAGDQLLLLVSGSWREALLEYRSYLAEIGLQPPRFPVPDWAARAAIYEVHAGQFGGFRGLARQLSRIKETGFNTIYLLPVQRYHNPNGRVWEENWSADGSPYAIRDFETLEPSLGGEEDFQTLVAETHRLGMHLLVDFVPQGCALDARYVGEHPDWFCRDEQGRLVSSRGWNDTYSFDWANPEYQRYMLEWSLRLMRNHGFDGYRVDAPLAKEPNWDRSIPYRASATNLGVIKLLEKLQRAVKEIDPEAALLCELHGPLFTSSHDLCCDYLPCIQTYQMLQARLSPAEWSCWMQDHRLSLPAGALRVCFTETHDTRGFHPPAYSWRGSQASKAGMAALVLAGFIPMIWSGQEEGQEEFFGRLLRARAGSAALLRGEVIFDAVPCSSPWVLSILRRSPDQAVWGLISLLPEKTTFTFSMPLEILGVHRDRHYLLKDLISLRNWSEYGKESWRGGELSQLSLTPQPFVPAFLELEARESIHARESVQARESTRLKNRQGFSSDP
jgi:glycosidase